jgi:hypothetical protein
MTSFLNLYIQTESTNTRNKTQQSLMPTEEFQNITCHKYRVRTYKVRNVNGMYHKNMFKIKRELDMIQTLQKVERIT